MLEGSLSKSRQCLDQNLGLLAPSTSKSRVRLVLLHQADQRRSCHLTNSICLKVWWALPSEKDSSYLPRGHP